MSADVAKLSTRSNCAHCQETIKIQQIKVSCENCQNVFHKTCSRKILKLHRNVFYCKQCLSSFDLMKYNPYYELLEENKDHDDTKFSHNEPIESMEIIEEYSSIL